MIVSALNIPDGDSLEADICIVGAGAAGITTALQFIDGTTTVLVLESGGFDVDNAAQDLYGGTVVDERLHSPPDRYRQRRFGGSTTIWGGRCVPFDAIDFEARNFIPGSGWPIGLESLAKYYAAANRLCEAGEFEYGAGRPLSNPVAPMMPGFASEHFSTDTLERFSCPTDFGKRYRHKLQAATSVRVVLHANATVLDLDTTGKRVTGIKVRTLSGRTFAARATHYVLATGGLEVARLLLASRDVHTTGVGNRHDVVGRYYMSHLAGTLGAIQFSGTAFAVHHGYDISDDGVYCRRRIALTAATQRKLRLANFVARLHHPRITDPAHRNSVLSLLFMAKAVIPYEYAKRLHGDEATNAQQWLHHLRNVLADPLEAVAFGWHMLRDRKLAERKFPSIIIKSKANLYSLDFHAEQQPNRLSRVTLGDDVDSLGMRRLRIDWRYNAADVDAVSRSIALLAADIERSGVGRFDYDPAAVEFEMTRYGAYGGHHIGTTRMGDDTKTSVVNADCRLHDVDNLFVVGSAVFTTSSQANPTLTIVAMALRLAGHLKELQRASCHLSAAPTLASDAAPLAIGAPRL